MDQQHASDIEKLVDLARKYNQSQDPTYKARTRVNNRINKKATIPKKYKHSKYA